MDKLNETIVKIINDERQVLCEEAVTRQYDLQPDIWRPYGEEGLQKSIRDADHHFSYLVEALSESDPSLFVDYVMWLGELFEGLKFPEEVLPAMLECTRDVLREHLTPDMSSVINQYIDAALVKLREKDSFSAPFLTDDAPLYELAKQYLGALLRGERHVASRLILDAVERGESIKEIYLNVFQRSQHEIGRLWHANKVSVAQEHYCSAATQLIMSQLYSRIFSTEKTGRRFVGASVGGELHEIGIRMVADFFEMDGWDTYYMGANTPSASIVSAVGDHQADILGISATMPFHRGALRDLISEVRASDIGKGVKILVGGYALKASPNLWSRIGADGYAGDAQEATTLAGTLLMGKSLS